MTKQEISKLQIDLSKVNAIGQKYFDLFDKHIPVDISGNILIYDISNADCIVNIIRKNPNAKYFIYGNSFVNDAIKCINEWDIEFLDEIEICPDCGSILQPFDGKFGPYLRCNNRECNHTENMEGEKLERFTKLLDKINENAPKEILKTELICPKCGEGHVQ